MLQNDLIPHFDVYSSVASFNFLELKLQKSHLLITSSKLSVFNSWYSIMVYSKVMLRKKASGFSIWRSKVVNTE